MDIIILVASPKQLFYPTAPRGHDGQFSCENI